MRMRRGAVADRELCNGPGKLTRALGIGLEHNATWIADEHDGPIRIAPRPAEVDVVRSAPRIGITKAVDLDWRFSVRDSRAVSRPFPKA
jgi:DNA-3-methyladenine glycosylase